MSNLINQGAECNKKATILARTESGEYVGCKRKAVGKLSSKTKNQLLDCMDKTIAGKVAEEMMAKTRDGKCFKKFQGTIMMHHLSNSQNTIQTSPVHLDLENDLILLHFF